MFEDLYEELTRCNNSADLPEKYGLYFVFRNDDKHRTTPVYIGSATGDKGLYGRIHSGHLKCNYLESRFSPSDKKNKFQIDCKYEKDKGSGRYYIDKSTFRKIIGSTHQLAPGQGTLDFINNNFTFYTIEIDETYYTCSFSELKFPTLFSECNKRNVLHEKLSEELLKGFILALESMLIDYYIPYYNTKGKSKRSHTK
ncbi:hypothetical protein [Vibrio genomosp. F6]|uniref:Uncharacterized protein n=1 Tax=Vibrio genomosp. F6 str. FF-238 TaxID=1191298 RepID=A0A1E5D4I4_9VIBR|nr:hypothetical protein [Vibrio genomosp. F6]OEE78501.1 hypothetical protein A130_13100 [Vibrio genomosp. F6 str. FF-238]